MIAIGRASAAPTMRPKRIPNGSEFTFFENHPTSTPAMRPLKVEPITIPTICDDTSGDDRSADSPSKMPRMPPSTRPNTGLFMISPGGWGRYPIQRSPSKSLSARKDQQRDAHDEIDEDENVRRSVAVGNATQQLEY